MSDTKDANGDVDMNGSSEKPEKVEDPKAETSKDESKAKDDSESVGREVTKEKKKKDKKKEKKKKHKHRDRDSRRRDKRSRSRDRKKDKDSSADAEEDKDTDMDPKDQDKDSNDKDKDTKDKDAKDKDTKDKDRRRDRDRRDRRDRSRSRSRSRRRRRRRSRSRSRSRDRRRRSRRSRSRSRRRSRRSRSRSRHRRHRRRYSSSSSRSRSPRREKKSSSSAAASSVPTTVTTSGGITMPSPASIKAILQGQMSMQQAANPQLTRQARRLYVGNLPVGMGLNERTLQDFFNTTATALGIVTPNPVLSVWVSSEGTFCFVEFRAVVDATNAMTLFQGLSLGGRQLRIGRPADYAPPPPHLENYVVGFPPGQLGPTPAGLPMSTGATVMAPAIPGLGPAMSVNPLVTQAQAQLKAQFAQQDMAAQVSTRVLSLKNMVSDDDLKDDEDYEDLKADVKEECEKYGTVEEILIPRPEKGSTEKVPGQGKIFISFKTPEEAGKALNAVHGRMFNEQTVEAVYFSEEDFKARKF